MPMPFAPVSRQSLRCDGLSEGFHTISVSARGRKGATIRTHFVLDVPPRPGRAEPTGPRHKMRAAEAAFGHRLLKSLNFAPRFLVIVPIAAGGDVLSNARSTIASLEQQAYRDWRLVVLCDPKSASSQTVHTGEIGRGICPLG